jgi:phosphoserine phosphatase
LIAKRLGLTGAIGSKAEIKDNVYTGKMNGPLLHGKEKAISKEAENDSKISLGR